MKENGRLFAAVAALIFIIWIGNAGAASLAVIYPDGGENLVPGSMAVIRWSSSGLTGNVKINLRRGGSVVGTLTPGGGVPDTGSFSWHLPSDIPTGNDYKILIKSADNTVRDISNNNFRIDFVRELHPSTDPFLEVITPNGGETWKTGHTYTIRWTSRNVSGDVEVRLSAENGSYEGRPTFASAILARVPASAGSYSYAIPSDYRPFPDGYKVSIRASNGTALDYSDGNFRVIKDDLSRLRNHVPIVPGIALMPVELSILSIDHPSMADIGDIVVITLHVKNSSPREAKFRAAYIDDAGQIKVGEGYQTAPPNETVNIPLRIKIGDRQIGNGVRRIQVFLAKYTPSGGNRGLFNVMWEDSNAADHNKVVELQVRLPDLSAGPISSIVSHPSPNFSFAPGYDLVTIRIHNAGGASPSKNILKAHYVGTVRVGPEAGSPVSSPERSVEIPALPSGKSMECTFLMFIGNIATLKETGRTVGGNPELAAMGTVVVTVTPGAGVKDSDPSNNTREFPVNNVPTLLGGEPSLSGGRGATAGCSIL